MERTLRGLAAALLAATVGTAALAQAPDADAQDSPRGLRVKTDRAYPGYTLVSPLDSTQSLLVDLDGNVVHRWDQGLPPGGCFYMLDDGSLLRGVRTPDNPRFEGGGISGRIQRVSWDGELLWDWTLADDYQTLHHDMEPLPNGNLLVILWEHRFKEDAVAYGRDPAAVGENGIWPDAVYEVKPVPPDDAEVVWEWHVWDHLIQDFDVGAENYGSIPDHPERVDINAEHRGQPPMTAEEKKELEELEREMRALGYVGGDEDEEEEDPAAVAARTANRSRAPDWLHTNAIAYHAELDLIALSTPHLNEIWVIDHSVPTEDTAYDSGGRHGKGGDLLWRWGNPRTYGRGDADDQTLFYQHDPKWLGGADDLRLLVFNNGQGREFSSVDELLLPYDPEKGFVREPKKAFGPEEPVWSYTDKDGFFGAFISGAERLPNGNTLICEGPKGRVFEVTRDGEIVWEWWNDQSGNVTGDQGQPAPAGALFRATRIGADHPALRGRELRPE